MLRRAFSLPLPCEVCDSKAVSRHRRARNVLKYAENSLLCSALFIIFIKMKIRKIIKFFFSEKYFPNEKEEKQQPSRESCIVLTKTGKYFRHKQEFFA